MDYRIVDLARDYSGKIDDFAEARNSFLERKMGDELVKWVLFLDSDEEAPRKLLDYLNGLNPKETPYFWVRRVNLYQGKWMPAWNPDFKAALVSNRVRFFGRIHERITPKNPHGVIDIPIIHDQDGGAGTYRNKWYQDHPFYRYWLAGKKIIEVARGR